MKANHAGWLSFTVLLCVLSLTARGSEMRSCTWSQHLGNPERTAYTVCDGPDAPEILWKTSFPGECDTPPLVVGDQLVVLEKNSVSLSRFDQSSLVRMDLYTGRITGQMDSEEGNPYLRLFSDGINVYLIGRSPQSEDTFEIWRVNFEENELASVASIGGYYWRWHHSLALILDDRIIYPTFPLTCFSNPDFKVLWSADKNLFGHESAELVFVAADESQLYLLVEIENTEKIYALDINTGEMIWLRDLSGKARVLAVENSTLFVGGDYISALDTDTGKTLWRFTPEEWVYVNLVIGPDYIFATDSANQIYAIDKVKGRLIWQTELGGDPGWTSLVGGGQFLYCTRGPGERSKIVCFHAEEGTKVWEYVLPNETHTRPALANGILIVTLLRGEIYAFATDTTPDKGTTPSESPQPTTPPETAPASQTPEPQSPVPSETVPPESTPLPESPPLQHPLEILIPAGIFFTGILAVILIIYYYKKKSWQLS